MNLAISSCGPTQRVSEDRSPRTLAQNGEDDRIGIRRGEVRRMLV